jgi:long-chain acyl-CoA synthetase
MEAKTRYYEKPWLKFYPAGVPQTIEVPDKPLPQVFDEVASKYSGKDAIIFYGNRISYSKLKEDVDRFARALHELGVKKGDKLAIYLLNSPQFIISYFGALTPHG